MNEELKCFATIQSKEWELIQHVTEWCDTEAENKDLLIPVTKVCGMFNY